MARARNIKPGFCRNEDLAECSVWARLCFALLPMLADREGRLEDRPKRIKGELFPFDSVEAEPLLAELEQQEMIARYSVNGLALIQILAFRKHQNPHHREPESTLPPHPSLRLDTDGKYVKPEALSASHDDKAQGLPEAGPGLDPPRSDLPGGSNPADSGFLIPDSGSLIPDPGSGKAPVPGATANVGTAYGAITKSLKAAGMARVNPGELRFRALVDAGATVDEFLAYADRAMKADDPFSYLVSTVERERKRVAKGAAELHRGPLPGIAATVPSDDADRTAEYLRERSKPFTPEEKAKADEARKRVMAAVNRSAA